MLIPNSSEKNSDSRISCNVCGITRLRSSEIREPGWSSGVPNQFVTASLSQYPYWTAIDSSEVLSLRDQLERHVRDARVLMQLGQRIADRSDRDKDQDARGKQDRDAVQEAAYDEDDHDDLFLGSTT